MLVDDNEDLLDFLRRLHHYMYDKRMLISELQDRKGPDTAIRPRDREMRASVASGYLKQDTRHTNMHWNAPWAHLRVWCLGLQVLPLVMEFFRASKNGLLFRNVT